jgi:ribosomal protein L12E/L44/L45/RPP1/RPP2
MTNALRINIQQLASTFAAAVVTALRGANLDDILAFAEVVPAAAPARTAPRPQKVRSPAQPKAARASAALPVTSPAPRKAKGRLRRRSKEDIAKALAQVVAVVKTKKGGLRAEQIRAALKMESKEMPRILKEGLAKKLLKSKGQKRSTTYSAA